MRVGRVWIALAAVALVLGVGMIVASARRGTAAPKNIGHAVATTVTTGPSVATAANPGSPPTTASAATVAANQMVQGMLAQLAQLQQATKATNGGQPLTRAQIQAVVDATNKQLGIPGK